jgi:hypothetical protein
VKKGKSKMVGTVTFNLEPLDVCAASAEAAPPEPLSPPENQPEVEAGAAVLPATPQLPFTPNLGLYTQLWTSQSVTTAANEMKDGVESSIENYTNANQDYNSIQMTILNSLDWMGFLTVLPGNQVVQVHSLGFFSSGLGRPRPAHNRMFGLLG